MQRVKLRSERSNGYILKKYQQLQMVNKLILTNFVRVFFKWPPLWTFNKFYLFKQTMCEKAFFQLSCGFLWSLSVLHQRVTYEYLKSIKMALFPEFDDDFYNNSSWTKTGAEYRFGGIEPHQFREPFVSAMPHLLPNGCRRSWPLNRSPRDTSLDTNRSSGTRDSDGFFVSLDVHQFEPDEITVKTIEDSVLVEGKHEEKQDQHGYISRHFVRRFVLPIECNIRNVTSSLSSDGVLVVKAPLAHKEAEGKERIIPIQQMEPTLSKTDLENEDK